MDKKIEEDNKRHYASIAQKYIKGKRIKLTPNEKCLLGLIVYRADKGTINLANNTICGVFGWSPSQVIRACNGLISKGIIDKDSKEAVHGQQGSEYTLLLERSEAEQQPSEQQLQYQPILVQTVQEPPHVKPFHEQQTQQDGNEVISLLKQHLEALNKQQNEFLHQHFEALGKQVEHLANVIIQRNKSSVSPSNSSDEQLPTKEEIVDSTPTPHADLDTSDEVLPTPHQSEYLMAIATAEAGGTIGGLGVAKVEPTERERTLQEARQMARKVKNNCEKNGMSERDAAMKARKAIEKEYGSKLGFDPTFLNMLDKLTYYATGMDAEFDI